jgi:hypothetical protein
MSGDYRQAGKQEKRVARAARSYNRRLAEIEQARANLNRVRSVADPAEVERLNAALDVEAGNLRSVRESLVESSRAIGVGVTLAKVS